MMANETVVNLAKMYVKNKNATFKSLSEEFGISQSKIAKFLNVDLKEIDPKLYTKVQKKKNANIERTRKNFDKCESCNFFCKIINFFKK